MARRTGAAVNAPATKRERIGLAACLELMAKRRTELEQATARLKEHNDARFLELQRQEKEERSRPLPLRRARR